MSIQSVMGPGFHLKADGNSAMLSGLGIERYFLSAFGKFVRWEKIMSCAKSGSKGEFSLVSLGLACFSPHHAREGLDINLMLHTAWFRKQGLIY